MKQSKPHGLKIGQSFNGRFRFAPGCWFNGTGTYIGNNQATTIINPVNQGPVTITLNKGEWRKK